MRKIEAKQIAPIDWLFTHIHILMYVDMRLEPSRASFERQQVAISVARLRRRSCTKNGVPVAIVAGTPLSADYPFSRSRLRGQTAFRPRKNHIRLGCAYWPVDAGVLVGDN